jgi:hypothetical protein
MSERWPYGEGVQPPDRYYRGKNERFFDSYARMSGDEGRERGMVIGEDQDGQLRLSLHNGCGIQGNMAINLTEAQELELLGLLAERAAKRLPR